MGWRTPGQRAAHLRIAGDSGGGVTSIIAGAGISIAPVSGVGDVTITATGPAGFGGAPPNVASASAAGVAATAARSDHTHGLDIVTYTPSVAGMQAAGVIQQTFPGPTAVPAVFTTTSTRIPFGNGAGLLTDDPGLIYTSGANPIETITGTGNPAGTFFPLTVNISNNAATSNAALQFQRAATRIARLQVSQTSVLATGNLSVTFILEGAVTTGAKTFGVGATGGTANTLLVDCVNLDTMTGTNLVIAAAGVNGYLWQPQITTNPTGVPAPVITLTGTSRVATAVDATNFRFYAFMAGAWRYVQFGGTLAKLYAFGVADNPAVDNTLVGAIDSVTFDSNGRINVATNVGQEADTNAFLNLTHLVAGNGDWVMKTETVEFNVASGVNTLAGAQPTGWRTNYVLKLDASASTFQAGHERIVMANSIIGGAPWFPDPAPVGQTPITIKELGLMRPDGAAERLHQWTNGGTYAHQVFSPVSAGSNEIIAAEIAVLNAAAGGTPTVGGGTGWWSYGGFGTLPLLGMFNIRMTDNTFNAESMAWDWYLRQGGVTTKVAQLDSTGLNFVSSITSAGATGLGLHGNATSNWDTSAGSIIIRANLGGVLGTTSTQITMSTATDITVIGNLVGAVGLGTLGVIGGSVWDSSAVTQYNIASGGASAGNLQSGGLNLTAAATQSISKSNGLLFVQTTTANDLVFRTNSAEWGRIDNATNALKFVSNLTAPGAVAVAITNAPAGVGATPAEYVKVLGTGGATRYLVLLG
jgi:hypothetical protein